jgi:peptidyl-tRNA hydrolase
MSSMTKQPFISAHKDPEDESPWALQCVVKDTKDFTGLQLAHALATSVASFLDSLEPETERYEAYQRWMNGRIRKILRRAKNSAWDAVQEVDGETYEVEGVSIRVLTPTAMDSIPRQVAKCQVSHLSTTPDEKATYGSEKPFLKIYTNRSLNMSAPKAAVAAAHVAQLMAMKLTDEDYSAWKASSFALSVSSLGEVTDFVESVSSVAVHDAGLTEVVPGSITAIGIWTADAS